MKNKTPNPPQHQKKNSSYCPLIWTLNSFCSCLHSNVLIENLFHILELPDALVMQVTVLCRNIHSNSSLICVKKGGKSSETIKQP